MPFHSYGGGSLHTNHRKEHDKRGSPRRQRKYKARHSAVAVASRGDAKRTRPRAQHEVRTLGRIDALDPQRRLRLDIENAADLRIGCVAYAQGSGRRALLHASGDIHSDAVDRSLVVPAAADQDVATVDADAKIERSMPVIGLHFRAQFPPEIPQ